MGLPNVLIEHHLLQSLDRRNSREDRAEHIVWQVFKKCRQTARSRNTVLLGELCLAYIFLLHTPFSLFTTYLGIISLLSLPKTWRLGENISTMLLRPLVSGRLRSLSTHFSGPYWGLSWVCLKHFLTIGIWLKMSLTLLYYIYITKYPLYYIYYKVSTLLHTHTHILQSIYPLYSIYVTKYPLKSLWFPSVESFIL